MDTDPDAPGALQLSAQERTGLLRATILFGLVRITEGVTVGVIPARPGRFGAMSQLNRA